MKKNLLLGKALRYLVAFLFVSNLPLQAAPNSPCDSKIIVNCGLAYTAELSPTGGEWDTYIDLSLNFPGTEQVFEFTAPSTANYTILVDGGFFTIRDGCSNTANNIQGGYLPGYSVLYLDLNAGQTIFLIADLPDFISDPRTAYVKINCPISNSEMSCTHQMVPDDEIYQGRFLSGEENYKYAIDVITGDTGFTANGITLNLGFMTPAFTDPEPSFKITIYNDNAGLPGSIANDNGIGSVHSSNYLNTNFGYDFYKFVFELNSPVHFASNSKYWIEIESNATLWQYTETDIFGSKPAFKIGSDGDWMIMAYGEFVYKLICGDLGTSDLHDFEFNFYPNPTQNWIYLSSEKEIKSVSIFDLSGKLISPQPKLEHQKIDLSNLSNGTYLFKVILENGQIETFKVLKK